MTKVEWNYPSFTWGEFDSKDEEDSGLNMCRNFMTRLQSARDISEVPYKINSGYRTEEHNDRVGGVTNSSHLKGKACDISAPNSIDRMNILKGLIKAGFTRIGIADTFIHVDNDHDKPDGVVWLYES
jgi:uncharacterized protein YcbK (DUF882 family)